jgi:DNA-binding NarL/FixJ family response regulator
MLATARKSRGGSTVSPNRMHGTTVLLADDHTIVIEGLARLLREHGFDVVGAVANGKQLIETAKRLRPEVIVTDLSMPELSGLEVLPRLKAEQVKSKIIVLTMHRDADLATTVLRAGASGFLLKESAGDELIAAIRQVLQGRVYLTPALTKDVVERMASPSGALNSELTPRQRDVLRLIVRGQRMKEIAANLGLSIRTVETHKYEMMQALNLHSTAELVRYALDRRLILD